MTDESKALPDWKPEDGCVPDEWIIAWGKGQLTEEQGDVMCDHCSECRECEIRLCDNSFRSPSRHQGPTLMERLKTSGHITEDDLRRMVKEEMRRIGPVSQ